MGCILCCCKKEADRSINDEQNNLSAVTIITSAPTIQQIRESIASSKSSKNSNGEQTSRRISLRNSSLEISQQSSVDTLNARDLKDKIATVSEGIDNKAFAKGYDYDQTDGGELLKIYDVNKNYRKAELGPSFSFSLEKIISQNELMSQLPNSWSYRNIFDFKLHDLDEYDTDYQNVKLKFDMTTPRRMVVQKIQRIENLYLWLKYQLKKSELTKISYDYKELQLFHGTKERNIESIGLNNFNWRKFGSNYGSRFGRGISFSPVAAYSHYYTDQNYSGNTIILARVLVSSTCIGNSWMVLPDSGCDTSVKVDRKVYVKYDDHTYYPEFVITYMNCA